MSNKFPESGPSRDVLNDTNGRQQRTNVPIGWQNSLSESFRDYIFWLHNQSVAVYDLGSGQPDPSTLLRMMEDLDNELFELIRIENQMQAISLKCREVRANIEAKSSAVQMMLRQLCAPKTTESKETQTEIDSVVSKVNSYSKLRAEQIAAMSSPKRYPSQITTPSSPKTPTLNRSNRRRASFTISRSESVSKDLSDGMKIRLGRLPAMVKGYLTRRLMKTNKVMQFIKEIKEIKRVLNETPRKNDKELQKIFMPQLQKKVNAFYDIFFRYSKSEQMALIAQKRNAILDQHYKNGIPISEMSYINFDAPSPNTSKISSATKKTLERKRNETYIEKSSRPAKVSRSRTLPKIDDESPPVPKTKTRVVAKRNATKSSGNKL